MAKKNIKAVIKGYSRQKEEEQAKLVAQEVKLPYINLVNYPFTGDVLGILPEELVKKYSIIAFERLGNTIRVATPTPYSPGLAEQMNRLGQVQNLIFEPYYCSTSSIAFGVKQYEKLVRAVKELSAQAEKQSTEQFMTDIKNLEDLSGAIKNISTSDLLELILSGALSFKATDIHFEPGSQSVRIRFRIDGDLVDITQISPEAYHLLTSRIKNLAGLKLNRSTSSQDGRFTVTVAKESIDVRANILPASYGETIELRLLTARGLLGLEQLGLNQATIKAIKRNITKEYGMIILTGPTGSGKTTTLYAILQLLNTEARKIITIEDPVEYKIAGIEQIQVDNAKGFGFAEALRAILRQDPDVILVGEIRDKETAEIAINASLTGHLVLTTLHANSAAATFVRLTELGAPANLVADATSLIVAQRLVKKASNNRQKGVAVGRIAIAEYLEPTDQFQELVRRKATISEFEAAFEKIGNTTLAQDLANKIAEGKAEQPSI